MKERELSGIQLKMNFEESGDNRFKELLDKGVFNILVEVQIPRSDAKLDSVLPRFSELLSVIEENSSIPAGFAFIDQNPHYPGVNMVEFASRLCPDHRDRHVLYIHGRGRGSDDIASEFAGLSSERFRNIVAVSGYAPASLAENAGRLYYESVETLRKNMELSNPLFSGCVVNPYKYRIQDSMAQYFKLSKKLEAGASFVVSQAGWDMRKIQELRWNMYRKTQYVPTFARLEMLTPQRAGEICTGRVPGVIFSPDFASAVREEMAHSNAQFEAAQLRRLQIHAAGAMLLGYSGVQISGIEGPAQLRTVLSRIAEAIREFHSLPEWIMAHNDYYARMELVPYPYRYYMFEKLLDPETTLDNLTLNRTEKVPPCSWSEWMKYKCGRILLSRVAMLPPGERRLTKKLLASCPGTCCRCVLPATHYVCPMGCQKGLVHGPCGDSLPNGVCPLMGRECIHISRIRIAVQANDYDSLEQIM